MDMIVFLDPLEFSLPLLTTPVHFYRSPKVPPENLTEMNNHVCFILYKPRLSCLMVLSRLQ